MTRSSSVDDASLSLPFIPPPLSDESTRPHTGPVTINRIAQPIIISPPIVQVEECRGRSRSRSSSRSSSFSRSPRRLSPIIIYPNRRCSRSRSPSPMRSRSPSPRRRRCICPPPRSISPCYPYIPSPSRSPSPCSIPIITPGPTIITPPPPRFCVVPPVHPVVPGPMSPPSPIDWCGTGRSGVWSTQVPKQPVDILTFHYNKNMAYAPAAKTYDEAIDIVLELWPELREVERDQIRLLVTGSDHLVRVPRMTWSAVLCDVPRYEVVHVQVEQLPPPPQYQGKGKGKGKWGDNDDKGRRSSGLFSSIKRIFFG